MKNQNTFSAALFLIGIVFQNCAPSNRIITSSKTIEVPVWKFHNPAVYNIPLVATHEPLGNEKVKGSASIKTGEGSLEDAKTLAVADAISKVPGCDQLINPYFSTVTENKIITAEVIGYPVKLKDLRPFQLSDTTMISLISKFENKINTGVSGSLFNVSPGTNQPIVLNARINSFKTEQIAEVSRPGDFNNLVEGGFSFFNPSEGRSGNQLGVFVNGKFGVNQSIRMGFGVGYYSKSRSNEQLDSLFGRITSDSSYTTVPFLGILEFNLVKSGPIVPYLGLHGGFYGFALRSRTEYSATKDVVSAEANDSFFGIAPTAGLNLTVKDQFFFTGFLKYNYIFAQNSAIKAISGGFGAGLRF